MVGRRKNLRKMIIRLAIGFECHQIRRKREEESGLDGNTKKEETGEDYSVGVGCC
jgi:hypothetical protein